MDDTNNPGDLTAEGQQLRHTHLRGQIPTIDKGKPAHIRAKALIVLAQTLAKGNITLEDQILRRWGIR